MEKHEKVEKVEILPKNAANRNTAKPPRPTSLKSPITNNQLPITNFSLVHSTKA